MLPHTDPHTDPHPHPATPMFLFIQEVYFSGVLISWGNTRVNLIL